jgi:hypothetical protein
MHLGCSDGTSKAKRAYKRPIAFPTNSNPYGFSYKEWTGKWWQWALSIPKRVNPLTDSTGKYCSEGQSGPVWFLAGTTGKIYSSKRKCTIPCEKAILFPVIASQFSFSELSSIKTDQELISHTARDIDRCSFLEVKVDGETIPELYESRVRFGPFDLYLPPENIWNVKPGATRAVSDGFWTFLRPLTAGDHTISFHGVEPNFETTVTYCITIKIHPLHN